MGFQEIDYNNEDDILVFASWDRDENFWGEIWEHYHISQKQ